ncbi:MAG: hypothetical protein AAF740_04260 [Bacteroidota bacterium]
MLVISPIIIYEPATSFGIGNGTKFLFKPKNARAKHRTSNIPVAVLYTLKNQFIVRSEYPIFAVVGVSSTTFWVLYLTADFADVLVKRNLQTYVVGRTPTTVRRHFPPNTSSVGCVA